MELKGIDLSKHNGTVDWDRIKASGKVDFAIIRTGFGRNAPSQRDIQFERNYAGAKRVGIPIGAYHYSYALSPEQAEWEADFVLDILKGKQFEFPIYYDIEEKTQAGLSMDLCGKMVTAFCSKLEKANYWVGLYSYDSFFKYNVADDLEARYAMWVARTPTPDNGVNIVKPTMASRYQMHQWTWKGSVDGSSAETDMNICTVDYPTLIKKAKKNGYGATVPIIPSSKYRAIFPNISTKGEAESIRTWVHAHAAYNCIIEEEK